MPLAVGTQLGPYEILAPIGKGGMGEVWKGRDTKLDRDVAIKILPESFAHDAERVARFEREAKVLAALNHPNIAQIYGLEERALVMEFVEGPTLAERIAQGALPLEEALGIAKQIADALEAAHEKGITHRDLKPANVKITPAGVVKVLDFGLATAAQSPTPDGNPSISPTLTLDFAATRPGIIMGTVAYMSPEQASGKPVDKRSDIWSFGVVLWEMLTGKRLFHAETISHTLAAVLKDEPDLTRVPARMRSLLQSCLEKDPKKRLRDIGDAWRQLDQHPTILPVPSPSRLGIGASIAAGVLLIALGMLSFIHFRETPLVARVTRFQIPLPEKAVFGGRIAVSPDGRRVALTSTGPEGGVWVRDLDSLEARLLPGTQNAFNTFWSPDNRFLAFGVGNQLKRVDASGGPPQTLCESPTEVGSGAWNQDGVIIFGDANNGHLRRVSAAGGVASDLTVLDVSRAETFHALPSFLPDGRHFVYLISSSSPEVMGIYVGSLDAKPEQQSRERLLAGRFGAVYAAGHLFFMSESTLMAQAFDAAKIKLVGDAMPIAEQVGTFASVGSFSVSASGVLAHRTGGSITNRQLTWFDRQGRVLGAAGEPGPHTALSLSPDGARAAIVRTVGVTTGDVWLHDFARGVSTRFTFDGTAIASVVSKGPVWSPDGNRIMFRLSRGGVPGNLYEKASNGAGEETAILQSAEPKEPNDWSRDGAFLLYSEQNPKTNYDLMALPLRGDRKPILLLRTPFAETQGSFSPDTHWFAYVSNDSGRSEIYVQPFTPPGAGSSPAAGITHISRDGGTRPKWRADGKEIIFRALNGSPMAVDVSTAPTFQPGIPKQLFALPTNVGDWDVTSDGKRFLVAMPVQSQQNANTPITVVLNWDAGLKK